MVRRPAIDRSGAYWTAIYGFDSLVKQADNGAPRRKIASGEWQLMGNHPLDHYARR